MHRTSSKHNFQHRRHRATVIIAQTHMTASHLHKYLTKIVYYYMTDISENIIIDASSAEWPPIFIRCDLCDFETMEVSEIKKHIITEKHQKREKDEGRPSLGWFWYFSKII